MLAWVYYFITAITFAAIAYVTKSDAASIVLGAGMGATGVILWRSTHPKQEYLP